MGQTKGSGLPAAEDELPNVRQAATLLDVCCGYYSRVEATMAAGLGTTSQIGQPVARLQGL